MKTDDDEILARSLAFVDGAKKAGKPFFLWLNPTRMHVVTHLSEKYEKMRTPENGWSEQEAGMAQLDDIVGAVMQGASFNMEALKAELEQKMEMLKARQSQ